MPPGRSQRESPSSVTARKVRCIRPEVLLTAAQKPADFAFRSKAGTCPFGHPETRSDSQPHVTGPATPETWPALGDWLSVSRDDALGLFPTECYNTLWSEHRLFGQTIAVVCDPAAIAEILGPRAAEFKLTRMHLRMLTPALRRGVIVAEGEQWKRHRRAAMKVVANRHLMPVDMRFSSRVDDLVKGWQQLGESKNVGDDLAALALETLAARLFGHESDIADEALAGTIRNHRQTMEAVDWLDIAGAPLWLTSSRMRRGRAMVTPYLARIEDELNASTHYTSPSSLDRGDAQDLVTNLMVGFESIAATCSWFLALAAALPDFAHWLRRNGSAADAIEPNVRLSLLEVLRLYPPLPFIFREARTSTEVVGHTLRKGTIVCISPFIVQRHAKLWHHPLVFDPERMRQLPQDHRFMPFSVGARRCVGRDIGFRICSDILVSVLSRLHPVTTEGIPDPRAGLSLRPRLPLRLRFESLPA